MVFRVQPAVVLKGDGYYFDKNWGTHGHTPITAAVLPASCTQTNCYPTCAVVDCAIVNVSIASNSKATSGVAADWTVATSPIDATKTSTFSGKP